MLKSRKYLSFYCNIKKTFFQFEMTINTISLSPGSYSANERSRSEFQGFDELILNFMKEHSVPGISLVISNKGAIRYTQCML